MTLPARYQFLNDSPLPKLLEEALKYINTKEYPGKQHNNPVIMEMAKDLGVQNIYKNDETAWCALFMNYIIKKCGKPMVELAGDIWNLLRAKWLSHWGKPVERGDERCGDVGIFERKGGGHVALIIAETSVSFIVFGANQDNSVGFTEIAKTRLMACRRYYQHGLPEGAKRYVMDSTGKFSTNEA